MEVDDETAEVESMETNPLHDVEGLKACSKERLKELVKGWKEREVLFKADSGGFNIMHHAAMDQDLVELIRLLLDVDRDLMGALTKEQMMPLHLAAAERNPEALALMLRRTIDDELFRVNLHQETAFYLSIKRNNCENSLKVMRQLLEEAKGITFVYGNPEKMYYDLLCEYQNIEALRLLFEYDNPLEAMLEVPPCFLLCDWCEGLDLYFKRVLEVSEEPDDRSLKDVVYNHFVLSQIIKYSAIGCLKMVVEEYGVSLLEPTMLIGYYPDRFEGSHHDNGSTNARNYKSLRDYSVNLAITAFRSASDVDYARSKEVLGYILKNVSCDDLNKFHTQCLYRWRRKNAMLGWSEIDCLIHSADEFENEDDMYSTQLSGCDVCSGSIDSSIEDHYIVFPVHPVACFRTSQDTIDNLNDDTTLQRVRALISMFKEHNWHLSHRVALITGCIKFSSLSKLSSLEVLCNVNMSTLLEREDGLVLELISELILPYIDRSQLKLHARPQIIGSLLAARFGEYRQPELAFRPDTLHEYLKFYNEFSFGEHIEDQLFKLIDTLYDRYGIFGVKTLVSSIEIGLPLTYDPEGRHFETPFTTSFEMYILDKTKYTKKRITLPIWNVRLLNKLIICGLPFGKLEVKDESFGIQGHLFKAAANVLGFEGNYPMFLLMPPEIQGIVSKYLTKQQKEMLLRGENPKHQELREHLKKIFNCEVRSLMQLCRGVLRQMFRAELMAFRRPTDKEPCFDIVQQQQRIPKELTSYIGCYDLMVSYISNH